VCGLVPFVGFTYRAPEVVLVVVVRLVNSPYDGTIAGFDALRVTVFVAAFHS
jgi:hypothetical protein